MKGENQPLAETTRLVAQRISVGLLFMVLTNIVLSVGDVVLSRPHLGLLLALKGGLVAVLMLAVTYLRRARSWMAVIWIGLSGSGLAYTLGGISGVLTGDVVTARLNSVTLALGSALLVPWGTWPQLASVLMAALSVLLNTYLVHGSIVDLYTHPAIIVVVIGLLASVYGSGQSRSTIGQRDLARRRAEDERDSFFDISPDLLCVGNRSGHLTKVNRAWEEQLGWSAAELTARPWIELVHPEDRQATLEMVATRSDFDEGRFVNRWLHKDGSYRWLSWTASRRLGGVVYAAARDVTEQRAVADALRASESRLRTLVDAAGTPILVVSLQGQIVDLNPAAEQVFGWHKGEVVGEDVVELLVPGELRDTGRQILGRVLKGEAIGPFEARLSPRRGRDRQFLFTATRLLGPDDRPTGVVAIAQDITHRKRLEAYRTTLLELAKEISGTRDRDELLSRVQERAAAALPCHRVMTFAPKPGSDSYHMRSYFGVPPELVAPAMQLEFTAGAGITRHLVDGSTLVVDRDSEQQWFEAGFLKRFGVASVLAVPFQVQGRTTGVLVAALNDDPQPQTGDGPEESCEFDSDQIHLFEGIARQLGVAMEASDLARARDEENAVSAALARVGGALISCVDPTLLMDRLCRVTAEVLACDASHTYLPQDADGAYCAQASFGYAPAQWEALRVMRFAKEQIAPLVRVLERQDLLVLSPQQSMGLPQAVFSLFGVGNTWLVALRGRGGLIGVQSVTFRQDQGEPGQVQRRIALGLGRLASMALESAQLFQELERANRFKADFLATMSHELRTPLNVIIGYGELLRDGTFGALSADQADTVERIARNSRDLLHMVNATLDLSRFESDRLPVQIDVVDVDALIGEIRDGMQQLVSPEVALRCQERAGARLSSDAIKIRMILENLLGNAIKFTSQGWVEIQTRCVSGGVELSVIDTGTGIPDSALPKIFEPFQQADSSISATHGGAGLGLYIVQRLVMSLRGRVHVTSRTGEDHGSRFDVWLPDLEADGSLRAQGESVRPTEAADNRG